MYEFIDSSDYVIALGLTNTITGDALNAIDPTPFRPSL